MTNTRLNQTITGRNGNVTRIDEMFAVGEPHSHSTTNIGTNKMTNDLHKLAASLKSSGLSDAAVTEALTQCIRDGVVSAAASGERFKLPAPIDAARASQENEALLRTAMGAARLLRCEIDWSAPVSLARIDAQISGHANIDARVKLKASLHALGCIAA
jgi:hypothetical protein